MLLFLDIGNSEANLTSSNAIQMQNSTNSFDYTILSIEKASSKEIVNNQARFCTFDGIDTKDDTIHTNREFPSSNNEVYECYYCENFTSTNDEQAYEKYFLNIHPKKSVYPFLSELKEMGIKPKGKSWEQQ